LFKASAASLVGAVVPVNLLFDPSRSALETRVVKVSIETTLTLKAFTHLLRVANVVNLGGQFEQFVSFVASLAGSRSSLAEGNVIRGVTGVWHAVVRIEERNTVVKVRVVSTSTRSGRRRWRR
jgi:hypothetical protein